MRRRRQRDTDGAGERETDRRTDWQGVSRSPALNSECRRMGCELVHGCSSSSSRRHDMSQRNVMRGARDEEREKQTDRQAVGSQ